VAPWPGALSFWLIEASIKVHQTRYYPRMGDIEVIAYEQFGQRQLPEWSPHR